jgi:hypothetical protein
MCKGSDIRPGVRLRVAGNPCPWSLGTNANSTHRVRIENQWPHSIDNIEIRVRATNRMIGGDIPNSKIKYASLGSRQQVTNDYTLAPLNTAAPGKTDEIVTGVAFHSGTQRSGNGFAGPKYKRRTSYLLPLIQ